MTKARYTLQEDTMTKDVVIGLILLGILLVQAGCPPVQTESTDPNLVQSQPAEPNEPPPLDPPPIVEPNDIETTTTQAPAPEPNDVRTSAGDPNDIETTPARTPLREPNGVETTASEPNEPLVPDPNDPQQSEDMDDPVNVVTVEPNQIDATAVEPNTPAPRPNPEGPAPDPNHTPKVDPKTTSMEPNQVEIVEPSDPQSVPPDAADANTPDPNQPPSQAAAFHSKCAPVLKEFVAKDGFVDYGELRRKRLDLKDLLAEFDQFDPNEYAAWSEPDKIAFWLNVYNMKMLSIITANFPIQSSHWMSIILGPYSIRNIDGIWTKQKFIVMDEEFTLKEVERRFLRKQFDDPRVFFALNYASRSGPPLRNEPYLGDALDRQLDDQVRRYLSGSHGFGIDRDKGIVWLSAIFQRSWYGADFITKYGTDKKFKEQPPETRAVLSFLTSYLPKEDVAFLEVENYTVKYIKYDWTVNDVSRRN